MTTETPRPSEPTGSGRRRAWTTLALASLTALLLGALAFVWLRPADLAGDRPVKATAAIRLS